jgi:hypothetical protein
MVGSGSNAILVVGLSGFKNDPATSVTFGAKPLARVGNRLGFRNVNVELWDLLNHRALAPRHPLLAPQPSPSLLPVTISWPGAQFHNSMSGALERSPRPMMVDPRELLVRLQ